MAFFNSLEGCLRHAAAAAGVDQLSSTSWSDVLPVLPGTRFARHRRQIAARFPVVLSELCPSFRPTTVALASQLVGGHWDLSPDPDSGGLRVIIRSPKGTAALAALESEEASTVRSVSIQLQEDNTAENAAAQWLALHEAGNLHRLRALEVTGSGKIDAQILRHIPRTVEELALYNVVWDEEAYRLLGEFQHLRSLTVLHRRFEMAKLPALPLDTLLFENAAGPLDKASLAALGQLSSLRRLQLRYAKLGKDAAGLGALTQLEELDLGGNPIDDAIGVKLAALPSLRYLGLGNTNVGRSTCEQVGASPALQEVDLEQVRQGAIGALGASRSLLALRMDRVPFDRASLQELSRASTLRFLWAFGTAPGLLELASKLPALDALHVRGGTVGPLERPLSLGELDLSRTDASDEVLRSTFGPALRCASLGQVPISPETLEATGASLKKLEYLSLNANGIGDRGFRALGEATSLRTLFSIDNAIGPAGIDALAALPVLHWLSLQGAGVDGQGFVRLCATPSLRRIHVDGPTIDDAVVAELSATAPLREAHLEGHGLSTAGVEALRSKWPDCLVRAAPPDH
ncbi:MAG: hypothetical protein JNL79_18770 [Myxococcales bacterium]|nr:hypothetical protein [Myxococcales bacterium]